MLRHDEIARTAAEVARAKFGAQIVDRVLSEDRIDSQGQDGLHLTIVLSKGSVAELDRSAILDALVQIHSRLLEAGDERLIIVDYASQDELQDIGEPKS